MMAQAPGQAPAPIQAQAPIQGPGQAPGPVHDTSYLNDVYNKQLMQARKSNVVDVHGITYNDYKRFSQENQQRFRNCQTCLKFYLIDNSLPNMLTDEFDPSGELVCYHCIFWLNYPMELRYHVSGTYKKKLVDYIFECKDTHNVEACGRQCFVCDYINKIPITGIVDGDQLYKPRKIKIDIAL